MTDMKMCENDSRKRRRERWQRNLLISLTYPVTTCPTNGNSRNWCAMSMP